MNKIRQLVWLLAAAWVMAITTRAQSDNVVDKCEWWLDGDFAGRTQVAITNNWQQDIDASALSPGLHSLGIRVGDTNGMWGQLVMHYFLVQRVSPPVGNALTTYEYWVDNKYAERTEGNVGAGGTVALDLDMSSLSVGLHQLALRVNDEQHHTSQLVVRSFMVQRVPPPPVNNTLTTYEYWIDNNYEARTSGNVGADGTVALDLDMSSLSAGMHQIALRVNDSQGLTSQLVVRQFFVLRITPTVSNALTTYEYWIDNNYEARTSGNVGADGTVALDLDMSALSAGMHQIALRVNDEQGLTSQLVVRQFMVVKPVTPIENSLATFRYWMDNRTDAITEVDASSGELAVDVDASALSSGLHTLHYQLKDAQDLYSPVNTVYFTVPSEADVLPENMIVAYEYWFDEQPRKRVEVTPQKTLTLTDAEIAVEGIEAKAVTEDYTLDAATKQVTVVQDVTFGLQVFNNTGMPSSAMMQVFKDQTVKIVPEWQTLENEETVKVSDAPTGVQMQGFEFGCAPEDEVYWFVEGAAVTVDFFDAEGNRLAAEKVVVGGNKAFVVEAPTDKVYALAYGATPAEGLQPMWVKAAVPATITIANAERGYGEKNPAFTYESNVPLVGTPQFVCEAIEESAVGTYLVTMDTEGVSNTLVNVVDGTLTVNKAPLTVKAKSYTIKQGDALPVLEVEYVGWKNWDTEDELNVLPELATEAISESAPGDYAITVSGAEDDNYELTFVNGTLTVAEADPVTITAKSYTIEYGDELPATFGFSSRGAKLVGVPELTCEVPEGAPAGTYPIVISKGSVANYNDTYVNGTLTIKKAMVTITADDFTVHQDEEMPQLTWKAEGWKKGEDESVLIQQPVCQTDGSPDSPLDDYVITVSGAEADNYDFTYVEGTLTVTYATGIPSLSNGVAPADIYTLQGFKVRSKSESLDGLAEGYYIVNRRKVFIRRR